MGGGLSYASDCLIQKIFYSQILREIKKVENYNVPLTLLSHELFNLVLFLRRFAVNEVHICNAMREWARAKSYHILNFISKQCYSFESTILIQA